MIYHPSHPSIKLALRARCVNPALDPRGNAKEVVEKGSGTIPTRLATVRARLDTVRARLARVKKSQIFAQKSEVGSIL